MKASKILLKKLNNNLTTNLAIFCRIKNHLPKVGILVPNIHKK